jgi:hypothetical protein
MERFCARKHEDMDPVFDYRDPAMRMFAGKTAVD